MHSENKSQHRVNKQDREREGVHSLLLFVCERVVG